MSTVWDGATIEVHGNGSQGVPDGPAQLGCPKQVKIGPFIYNVLLDMAKLQAHEREKRSAYSGYSSQATLEIVIGPDAPEPCIRETLWHEVKHQVARLSSYDPSLKLDEETWISKTSAMELATLRDNPALVAFLTSES